MYSYKIKKSIIFHRYLFALNQWLKIEIEINTILKLSLYSVKQ